jgi:hypothetical protein
MLEKRFGAGAYVFVKRNRGMSLRDAIAVRLRETEPKPKGLGNVFTFDGTIDELKAHNRKVTRSAVATMPRSRERRPTCASPVRGGRRGLSRSHSRGGDSGDDPSGEPEPGEGHLDESTTAGAVR